jgi:hypothetical protein
MSALVRAVAITGLAILALVFIWRAGAAASTDPTCVAGAGFVPQFCVNVPSALTRRDLPATLAPVATAGTELRVESAIPVSVIQRVATELDRATVRVERVFGRTFSERPRVLLYATPESFARGIADLFGYSPERARLAASRYAGVVDQTTLTVAVDLQAAARDNIEGLLAHELVHVMIRDVAGRDAALPAWFEEGLATVIQREDAMPPDTDALLARSLVANGVVSLDQLATIPDWHRTFSRVGRAQYAVAADAVRELEARIGNDGVVSLLDAVGKGARFEDAYAQLGDGTFAEFTAAFRDDRSHHAGLAVSAGRDAAGNVRWTLYAFPPDSTVLVRIWDERGYDVIFTITTDQTGMFRGSFGSTAPAGRYAILARSGFASATAELRTAP